MKIKTIERDGHLLELSSVQTVDLMLSHPSSLGNRPLIEPYTKAGFDTSFETTFQVQENDLISFQASHLGTKSNVKILVISVSQRQKKTMSRKPEKYTLYTFTCRVISNEIENKTI